MFGNRKLTVLCFSSHCG